MEKKTLGSFLAALRKSNGMTQKELAERLCVSDKAVSRWERDETYPDLTLIPVIADIFGVSSDELLRGERVIGDNKESALEGNRQSEKDAKSSERNKRSEREVKVYAERVLFRYLTAVLICIGSVFVSFFICVMLSPSFNIPKSFIIYNFSEGISVAVWIAAILIVILYYLSNRNKLSGLEGYESILEPAKVKLQSRFRWGLLVVIAMASFVFAQELDLGGTAFIIFGVIVGVPLLISFVKWLIF